MNRIKFTLIVSFTLLLKMFAKDYQTIYSDRTSFFIDQGNQIRCIKIDSVSFENDGVFGVLLDFMISEIQKLSQVSKSP